VIGEPLLFAGGVLILWGVSRPAFEHGLPIDRFEGTYIAGRRDGLGRYEWNDHDRFYGNYANDLPNGFGSASIAGEAFIGDWSNGCLRSNDRTVAIGVHRASCGLLNAQK